MGLMQWFRGWPSRKLIAAGKRRASPTRSTSFAGPGLEPLESRILPATVNWINPGGGDWDTASNWSSGQVPGAGDDAVISIPGITVTHSDFATDSVHSLTSQANLQPFPRERCRSPPPRPSTATFTLSAGGILAAPAR